MSCVESASVPVFLEPYGYLASDPREWQTCDRQPELCIRVTSHIEVDRHTQYHVECSITWPAKDGTHLTFTWGVERRLLHFRLGLHDPIKRELRSSYGRLFRDAHFAQRYGPKGTTEKLNRWCCRLAHCINSRTVPPIAVMLTLKALNAPAAPGAEPCASPVRPAPSESTAASWSGKDGSEAWSDLGLSDAESLEDETFPNGVDAFNLDATHDGAVDGRFVASSGLEGAAEESDTALNGIVGCSGSDEEDCGRSASSKPRCSSPTTFVEAGAFEEAAPPEEACGGLRPERHPCVAGVTNTGHADTGSDVQVRLRPCSGSDPARGFGNSTHVDLRPCDPKAVAGSPCELDFRLKLRPCPAKDLTEDPEAENAMQAKLRARKQIVDVQKISGRGMIF